MRFYKNQSIRTKIIVLIVTVSTVSVLLGSFVQFYYEKNLYNKEIKEKLGIFANVIADSNSATIIFKDQKAALGYLSALKADKHVENAMILLPDSSLFVEYKSVDRPIINKYTIPLLADTTIFDKNHVLISRPVVFEGEIIATIRIEYSLEEYIQKEGQYIQVMIYILLGSIITATVLAFLFHGGITMPIFNLYHVMNKISFEKDYSIRAVVKGKDETGKLTDGFNFMIQQIELQNNQLKKAKAQSDAALKTKERFLANMTHELRTPLNSIIGLSNLLEDTELNNEQKEYISNIKISSDHLLAIINDLLEFSKLGSGKYHLEKTEFSIRRTIDRIERSMEFELKNRKLKFVTKINKNIPHFVVGDEHRLNQVLINLVGNAIKFTPKGSVTVEANILSETDETINIEFKVVDTGIGIAKEKQTIIFDSFTQESNDTTRQYGGTGLGLAITKQLIEIQNGKIWVDSEKFEGSTFIFIIPYVKRMLSKPNDKPYNIESVQSKRVLVVDDNAMNLLFTKSLLDKHGFITETCENGKLALALISQSDFDIILMDLHMPDMDGYEASRQIRKLKNDVKRKVPIIALTAAATLNEIKNCFDSGMNDYLVKPFKKEELFSKLISLLINKPGEKND
jgi:two-component system, sensor histidine kinase